MKKIFATLVVVCFTLIGSSNVYALTPADLEANDENRVFVSEVYEIFEVPSFDYVAEGLQTYAKLHFNATGEKITWAVCSLNHHTALQFYIFYDKGAEEYEELISRIDNSIDFIQFGTLQDISLLESTKVAFENDSLKATLNAIMPISSSNRDGEIWKQGNGENIIFHLKFDEEKLYEQIKTHNIPIYWDIKENDETYSLEVAVGKYVIKTGDTLSEIALEHTITIERLLHKNSNITNPDLIYAGDYLIIK